MHNVYDLHVLSKTGTSGSSKSKNGEGKNLKAMDWLGAAAWAEGKTTNNNIYSNGKHEFREQSVSHSFQFPPKTLVLRQFMNQATHQTNSVPFLSSFREDVDVP